MRREWGFTLLELMTVLSIMAIAAAIGVPSFLQWRNEAKLRDATSLLRGDLEMARVQAVQENGYVAVLFNSNGYVVFVDDGADGGGILSIGANPGSTAGNWIRDGAERLLRNRTLKGGILIDLAGTTFEDHRTRFNGRGRIASGGIVTIVGSDGIQRQLDLNNRFGRITVH